MDWLENIKKLKKEKGMTNESLSALSGISAGTLNKLFSGATLDPKLSTLTDLSKALGCTLDEMLTGRKLSNGEILSPSEEELLKKYRLLDDSGRETASYIINKEYQRTVRESEAVPFSLETPKLISLRLYDIAASAGTGSYLSAETGYSKISVYSTPVTDTADFAVKIKGDSMNPKYSSEDVLLVSETPEIERGELGIFSLNGESYFKKFGGDRLISLNPAYNDIVFTPHDDVQCFGRVIGRLKK